MRELINPEVIAKLQEFIVNDDDAIEAALLYLLGIYYGINTERVLHTSIPSLVNFLQIVKRDYSTGNPVWIIPLFTGEIRNVEDRNWDWVNTEYRPKFSEVVNSAMGGARETVDKMKKFFANHPDVRKEEILQAADYYITEFKQNNDRIPLTLRYFKHADNFIYKRTIVDNKAATESRLEMYIEIIRKINIQNESGEETNKRFMKGVRR